MDPAQQQAQAMHLMAAIMPMIFLFALVMMAILIVPLWKIATKAGLAGPLALLAIIPGIGMLLALYIIAFSDWKVAPVAAFYPPPAYPPVPPAYPATQPYTAAPPAYTPPPSEPPTGV